MRVMCGSWKGIKAEKTTDEAFIRQHIHFVCRAMLIYVLRHQIVYLLHHVKNEFLYPP